MGYNVFIGRHEMLLDFKEFQIFTYKNHFVNVLKTFAVSNKEMHFSKP